MADPKGTFSVSLPGGIRLGKGNEKRVISLLVERIATGERTTLFVRNGWSNAVVEVLVRGPNLVDVRSDNEAWAEDLARRLHNQGIHSVKGEQ